MSYNSLYNRSIKIRPTLDQARILGNSKPTYVKRGLYGGYSLPIFNNDDEEILYRTTLPVRWDQNTPIIAKIYCYLGIAQDVGDKFNMDFLYQIYNCDDAIVPDSYLSKSVETTVVSGKSAQYSSYCIDIELPHALALRGDMAAGSIRRIAATSNEISGELVVVYFELEFAVDKMYGMYVAE